MESGHSTKARGTDACKEELSQAPPCPSTGSDHCFPDLALRCSTEGCPFLVLTAGSLSPVPSGTTWYHGNITVANGESHFKLLCSGAKIACICLKSNGTPHALRPCTPGTASKTCQQKASTIFTNYPLLLSLAKPSVLPCDLHRILFSLPQCALVDASTAVTCSNCTMEKGL